MYQDAIKVQPLLENAFSDGLYGVFVVTEVVQAERQISRDLSKISTFVCDDLEYEGDPADVQCSRPENRISKLRCFREVERADIESAARETYIS